MVSVDDIITTIREYVDAQGWSTLRLANEAGVPESTLRGWRHPGWCPNTRTLRRLHAIVPPDWQPASADTTEAA